VDRTYGQAITIYIRMKYGGFYRQRAPVPRRLRDFRDSDFVARDSRSVDGHYRFLRSQTELFGAITTETAKISLMTWIIVLLP
jgi:hypothetical protein